MFFRFWGPWDAHRIKILVNHGLCPLASLQIKFQPLESWIWIIKKFRHIIYSRRRWKGLWNRLIELLYQYLTFIEHCGQSLSDHEPLMATIQIIKKSFAFGNRDNSGSDCKPPSLRKFLHYFWNICLVPYLYEIFVNM